jgi:hypothetical protein
MNLTDADPKGLIRESFAIDGITLGECRSIYVDWALSLPLGADIPAATAVLLAQYVWPDHPMTATLQQGLAPAAAPQRKGGRAGRVG